MGVNREAPDTSNSISGGQQENVFMARDISGPITFTTAGRQVPAYLQDPLRWPLAGGWDALAAGTHRSRPDDSGDAVPPYVPRDQDAVIRSRLTRAADEGGLVLVVGDSTAGKTRACFEALHAELPDYRVVAPAGGPDLVTAAEVIDRTSARCAVWLDDLEEYLGPGGLEPRLLAELVRLRIPVLATMRHHQFEIFAVPESAPGTATAGARVLRQLDPVELDRAWSPSELERAGETDDDRIADALAHHGPYGIAEYLAAGPALFQEWHRAARAGGSPRGAALVAAAVDLARTGLRPPYALELLAHTHEFYLAAAGGPLLRPEPLDTALEWATRRRHSVTSMLVPTQNPSLWNVFDYLTDHTSTPVPDTTWHAALQHTTDSDELMALGVHAHRVAPVIAESVYRRAADAGHTNAMNNLGLLLATEGRTDEAEVIYCRAADAGQIDAMNNLGALLVGAGRMDEAEVIYCRAADAGHTVAMNNLGALLVGAGRMDEAEVIYCRAADAGQIDAMNNLGALLVGAGRMDEAESVYRRAADAGHPSGMYNLGVWLTDAGRIDEAEAIYRRAADAGHTNAMCNLGTLLAGAGRTDEAQTALRRAADARHPTGMYNLSILLADAGRTDEAERMHHRAAEAGHPDALNDIGRLLADAGRMDEAETIYRRAANAGHAISMCNLGDLLADAGRADEAESVYRQAIDAGYTAALNNLGALLAGEGRTDEAETALRRAANAGHAISMCNLGALLADAGRADEAESVYRQAIDAGYTAAMYNLGNLLISEGRLDEAADIICRAAEAGHTDA